MSIQENYNYSHVNWYLKALWIIKVKKDTTSMATLFMAIYFEIVIWVIAAIRFPLIHGKVSVIEIDSVAHENSIL